METKFNVVIYDLDTASKIKRLREKLGVEKDKNALMEQCIKLGVNQLLNTIELGEKASEIKGGIEELVEIALQEKDIKALGNIASMQSLSGEMKHLQNSVSLIGRGLKEILVELQLSNTMMASLTNVKAEELKGRTINSDELLSGALIALPPYVENIKTSLLDLIDEDE